MPSKTNDAPFLADMLKEAEKWIEGQRLKAPSMKNASAFERNLEEVLDQRRATQSLGTLHQWKHAVDFSSNDFLSLSTNSLLHDEFLAELARNPDFEVGSTGSRVADGNNSYMEALEKEIADFHGADEAVMTSSGYDANGAIFCAIPRPGDVIVYDELVHASVHDGMKHSLSQVQIPFRHNNVDSLRDILNDIEEEYPLIRKGQRCVLISVESIYSMDGDVCPLAEMLEAANEVFPKGNAQFIIDEAHSTGLIGKDGRGLVCHLGLEKQIAVRLHTYGKGMSTTGAAILSSATVKSMLLNFARPIIYTTAPSFPMLAAIKAGYNLCRSGKIAELQQTLQSLILHFFASILSDPMWTTYVKHGTLSIPLLEDRHTREVHTQFVPVWTREKYNYFLAIHLQSENFSAIPINPPVVPRGTGRVRLIIHAGNTMDQVAGLAKSILSWAKEMYEIETGKTKERLPSAMRIMNEMMTASGMEIPVISNVAGNAYLE